MKKKNINVLCYNTITLSCHKNVEHISTKYIDIPVHPFTNSLYT